MAAEITVAALLEYDNGIVDVNGPLVNGIRFDISGSKYVKTLQQIGITEEALQLGETSGSLGWALIKNIDNTNYVELKTGTGGIVFAKLPPKGGIALLHFGSGVTAPFAIANSAACLVEIFILSA